MRIFALSFPENSGSLCVQRKAGFSEEGLLQYGLARLATPRHAVVAAISRDAWVGSRAAPS